MKNAISMDILVLRWLLNFLRSLHGQSRFFALLRWKWEKQRKALDFNHNVLFALYIIRFWVTSTYCCVSCVRSVEQNCQCWYILASILVKMHLLCPILSLNKCVQYCTGALPPLRVPCENIQKLVYCGTHTVRKVLADVTVCDVWSYCKALCEVKFCQIL